MAAVDHGADAVYIGAPRFGARAAAGNSVEDIRKLCEYAHPYGVKVYVTVEEFPAKTYGDLTFPEGMPLTARNFVLQARAQFELHPFEKLPKASSGPLPDAPDAVSAVVPSGSSSRNLRSSGNNSSSL